MTLRQRLERYFLALEYDLYELECYGVNDIVEHARLGNILIRRYGYTAEDFDLLRQAS